MLLKVIPYLGILFLYVCFLYVISSSVSFLAYTLFTRLSLIPTVVGLYR